MHASRPSSDRRPAFLTGDEGVSEVVGQILMFGILSMVLILTLLSFNVAKEAAEERVLSTTSDSVAQRVASLVVETALFAENFHDRDMEPSISSRLELPATIENRQYEITMDGASITVTVPSSGRSGAAPLFAAGSDAVHVCAQPAFEGGDVAIRAVADTDPNDNQIEFLDAAGAAQTFTDCTVPPAPEPAIYIFLEPAT